jgi:hypothetical protein
MKFPGSSSVPVSWRTLLRAYGLQLRGWAGGIGLRYGAAAILLLSGGASLLAAVRVGFAALFHWLEANYGSNHAYAMVIGLLIFLGLACALAAVVLLKRELPPIPRPGHQTRALGRHLTADAIITASPSRGGPMKMDAPTEMLAGLAAACLVGWLVSSRIGASRTRAKQK